jgi:hypothetical protein
LKNTPCFIEGTSGRLRQLLDEDEKKSLFKIIDGLSSKKKMRDSLAKALAQ